MAYAYMKLSSPSAFRIMQLHGEIDGHDISFKLHEADWSNPPSYEAISYVWGDTKMNTTITCDGCNLEVSPNLKDCLHHLRLKDSSRYLWADAACIDQENTEERARQVRNMRKIYQNAEKVIVWLGTDKDGKAECASQVVNDLSTRWVAEAGISLHDLQSMGDLSSVVSEMAPHELHFDHQTIGLLLWLFKRSWFSRLWVLQEVANAKVIDVQCGTQHFSWDCLCLVATFIKLWTSTPFLDEAFLETYFKNAYIMRRQDFHARLSPPAMLDWAREFQTTDPLDRIYAMLGFTAFTKWNLCIPIDYAFPKMKLYTIVAAQMIEKHGLAVLSYVQHIDVVDENSPSWVPSWDCKYFSYTIGYANDGIQPPWSASKSISAQTGFDLPRAVLKLGGIIVDTCDRAIQIEVIQDEWFESELLNLYTSNEFPIAEPPTGQTRLQVLSATLVAGHRMIKKCQCCDEARIMCCDLAAYLVRCGEKSGQSDKITQEVKDLAEHGDGETFRIAARNYCWYRSIFSSKKGYCGIGSNCTRPGDLICVLFGGRVPYILRPKGNDYQCLGEAYIHGLMNGEVVDMWKSGELEATRFEIS
jgi:Heterokaryon incompatibility protein (HET)